MYTTRKCSGELIYILYTARKRLKSAHVQYVYEVKMLWRAHIQTVYGLLFLLKEAYTVFFAPLFFSHALFQKDKHAKKERDTESPRDYGARHNPKTLREACDDVGQERHERHRNRIGELRCDVVDVVALSARACHNGGV